MTKARFDNLIVDLGQVDAWEVQYQPAETEVFLGAYGQRIFFNKIIVFQKSRGIYKKWSGREQFGARGIHIAYRHGGQLELLPTIW